MEDLAVPQESDRKKSADPGWTDTGQGIGAYLIIRGMYRKIEQGTGGSYNSFALHLIFGRCCRRDLLWERYAGR